MYGGNLFGDLPTVKRVSSSSTTVTNTSAATGVGNDSTSNASSLYPPSSSLTRTASGDTNNQNNANANANASANANDAEKSIRTKDPFSDDATPTNNVTGSIVGKINSLHPNPNNRKSMSLVGALGNAGTTMAFLPTALRRKRPAAPAPPSTPAPPTSNPIPTPPLQRQVSPPPTTTNPHTPTPTPSPSTPTPSSPTTTPAPITESTHLQNLHSSIPPSQHYDPLLPNDYLAYRRRRENDIVRAGLERQAKRTLEMRKRLRGQIEEERKRAEEEGDVERIIESRLGASGGGGGGGGVGRGRGRGRGANNLPAWLVKKQKEQRLEKEREEGEGKVRECTSPPASSAAADPGQFEDAPSSSRRIRGHTVLLTNMVGPGEVDDELANEVREECELRCGRVLDVDVEVGDVDGGGEGEEVRVFVTFERTDYARKAEGVFHGRKFGSRQISTRLL